MPPSLVASGYILGNEWWKQWNGKHGKDLIITHIPVPRIPISDKALMDNLECGKKHRLHQKSPGSLKPGLDRI
jgi:hypothetical protein